jgi:hypothetical protein
MYAHRLLLLATVAAGASLVPVERAALFLLRSDPAPLYAEAMAGKEGRGGSGDRDHERGERSGKSGGHRGEGKTGNHDDTAQGKDARRGSAHRDHEGHSGDDDQKHQDAKKGRKNHNAKDHKERASRQGIRPADFVKKIDNPYFPLKPGTVFVYKGPGLVNKVRVTDRTKKILGVTTTVVKDIEIEDGELIEKTFDWYAQDKKGNVWYFGEKTAEYENGKIVSTAGAWKAGRNGARPGIIMQAKPKIGQTYKQEVAPGVAEDAARVESLNARAKVPYGTFRDALKTFEFTPLEPDVAENKYYARGVGQVLTIDLETGEREELVRIERR